MLGVTGPLIKRRCGNATAFCVTGYLYMPLPYVEQNQKNKLRQLAQQNNREFKKLLLG